MTFCKKSYKCSVCINPEARSCPSGGYVKSKFVILGESPGNCELNVRRPFSAMGATGRFLRGEMAKVGINIDRDCYILNALNCDVNNNCWSPEHKKKRLASKYCKNRVSAEIQKFPRALIFAFGNVSLKLLLNQTGIQTKRGAWQTWNGIDVLFTHHPAGLFRGPNQKKRSLQFTKDIQQVVQKYAQTGDNRLSLRLARHTVILPKLMYSLFINFACFTILKFRRLFN